MASNYGTFFEGVDKPKTFSSFTSVPIESAPTTNLAKQTASTLPVEGVEKPKTFNSSTIIPAAPIEGLNKPETFNTFTPAGGETIKTDGFGSTTTGESNQLPTVDHTKLDQNTNLTNITKTLEDNKTTTDKATGTEGEGKATTTSTFTPIDKNGKEGETVKTTITTDGEVVKLNADGTTVPLIDPDKKEQGDIDVKTDFTDMMDMMKRWMNGDIQDSAYEKGLNNYVSRIGLMNQAQEAALQQRIAQDPNLRGSGLAYGLLSQLGREQGMSAGQVLGQMSVDSANKLMQMQEYGITTAKQLEKEAYLRKDASYNKLLSSGNFKDAAKALEDMVLNNTGMAVTVDPASLSARSPFTMDQWNNSYKLFEMLAADTNNPQAAIDYFNENIKNNPDFAEMIKGLGDLDAETLVEGIQNGTIAARITANSAVQKEINTIATNEGSTYNDASYMYDDLQGRKPAFITSGKSFAENSDGTPNYDNLDEINSWREENGLNPLEMAMDEDGYEYLAIRTDKGDLIPLDEDDYAEIGKMKNFYDMKSNIPDYWSETLDIMKSMPEYADYLNDPEAIEAMRKAVIRMKTAPAVWNPETGLYEPAPMDFTSAYNDPNNYSIFYDWPDAIFDGENVEGANYAGGNLRDTEIFDENGNVLPAYASKNEIDKDLDNKFANYQKNGGKLSAQEWYYQSLGGEVTIDKDAEFNEEQFGKYVDEKFRSEPTVSSPTSIAPTVEVEKPTGPTTTTTIINDDGTETTTTYDADGNIVYPEYTKDEQGLSDFLTEEGVLDQFNKEMTNKLFLDFNDNQIEAIRNNPKLLKEYQDAGFMDKDGNKLDINGKIIQNLPDYSNPENIDWNDIKPLQVSSLSKRDQEKITEFKLDWNGIDGMGGLSQNTDVSWEDIYKAFKYGAVSEDQKISNFVDLPNGDGTEGGHTPISDFLDSNKNGYLSYDGEIFKIAKEDEGSTYSFTDRGKTSSVGGDYQQRDYTKLETIDGITLWADTDGHWWFADPNVYGSKVEDADYKYIYTLGDGNKNKSNPLKDMSTEDREKLKLYTSMVTTHGIDEKKKLSYRKDDANSMIPWDDFNESTKDMSTQDVNYLVMIYKDEQAKGNVTDGPKWLKETLAKFGIK